MTIYCPLCNKSSDDIRFVGNFCEECVIKKLEKNLPSVVTIYQCRWCRRIKEGKTFSHISKKALARAAKLELKLKEEVKVKDYKYEDFIDAALVFDVDGEKVIVPRKLEFKIAHETCQRCYQISSGYYESVVQLRGDKQRIENLIAKITKYVQRRGGFIAKIDNVDNGKDLYISDKLMTTAFFKDYDIKPVRSFRLYGMKMGRKLYRNTYALKFDPPQDVPNRFTKYQKKD